jgi:hypothetical protein
LGRWYHKTEFFQTGTRPQCSNDNELIEENVCNKKAHSSRLTPAIEEAHGRRDGNPDQRQRNYSCIKRGFRLNILSNKHRTPKASAMPFATTLPAAILQTILTRLAALFLTGAAGDMTAARHAVAQMLGAYRPETEDELRLAANIVGFSFQALEALSQAATPDMPLTRILRLRGSAVSLSRESAKAERRLDQVQKARREGIPAPPAESRSEPAQPEPKIEKALLLVEDTKSVAAAAKANGLTWTQAYEQRQREARIAARLKRAEARIAAQANIVMPGAIHHDPATARVL